MHRRRAYHPISRSLTRWNQLGMTTYSISRIKVKSLTFQFSQECRTQRYIMSQVRRTLSTWPLSRRIYAVDQLGHLQEPTRSLGNRSVQHFIVLLYINIMSQVQIYDSNTIQNIFISRIKISIFDHQWVLHYYISINPTPF